MNWDGVLVRFGEVGIKSAPVRRQMLGRLQNNLLDAMVLAGVEGQVTILGSRLWMVGPDTSALLDVATHTFGVVSASLARNVAADMEPMQASAVEIALDETAWHRFAIRASRDGKHAFTSQDLGIQLGNAVYAAAEKDGRQPKVDLTAPDLEVYVEVRDAQAYLYRAKVAGPGGLPVGSQGKVVALLSDANSAVAAWFMLRRGCRVVPVHAGDMGSAPVELIEALVPWGLSRDVDLLPACSGSVSKRALVEAAATLARSIGAVAVVTGDSLASRLVVGAGPVPVLRPVAGLDPDVVADWRQRIGGLEPDEDAPSIIRDESSETAETLLSMHRRIQV